MNAHVLLVAVPLLIATDIEVRVTPDKDELFLVTAHADHEPVIAVLKAICSRAGRPLTVTPQAVAEARAAVVSVDLEQRPFDRALEWIGGATGLEVRVTDDGVSVTRTNDEPGDREELVSHAIELYRRALVRYADHADAPRLYLEIGKLEGLQQQWPLALLEFETILRSFPSSPLLPEALFESGRAYLNAGDLGSGRQRLLSLAERRPDSPLAAEALLLVAGTYQGTDVDHTLHLIRQALDSIGDVTPAAKIRAAEMLLGLGEYTSAMQLCEDTLKLDASADQRQALRLIKLRVHKEMGDAREAAHSARAFLTEHQTGPGAVAAGLILAELALEAARPFEALAAVARAEQSDRTGAERFAIERLYALTYRDLQLPGRALPHFERALSLSADQKARQEVASIAARVAFDDEQYEVARKYFDLWRQAGGPVARSLLGAATCFFKEGRSPRALELLQTGLQQCDDASAKEALLALIGEIHERTGDFEGAARAFSGGSEHELDADDPRTHTGSR